MIVVVLDMDETLGVYHNNIFHVRPNIEFMIQMLWNMHVDIILWSLGDDDYVKKIVSHYLPLIKTYAYKLFARKEAKVAYDLYGFAKAGKHIRQMYKEDIFLIGVDDQIQVNMDSFYDIKIYVPPYKKPNNADRTLFNVCEKIVKSIHSFRDK